MYEVCLMKNQNFILNLKIRNIGKNFFGAFLNLITHYPYALCMVVRQLVIGFGKLLNIDVLCDPIPTYFAKSTHSCSCHIGLPSLWERGNSQPRPSPGCKRPSVSTSWCFGLSSWQWSQSAWSFQQRTGGWWCRLQRLSSFKSDQYWEIFFVRKAKVLADAKN